MKVITAWASFNPNTGRLYSIAPRKYEVDRELYYGHSWWVLHVEKVKIIRPAKAKGVR